MNAQSSDHVEEAEIWIWSQMKIHLHGEHNSAGGIERSKNERKTEEETEEEMRRQHQRMDRNGVWRFPEDILFGRQGKVEQYCFNVICGAPKNFKAK